MPFTTTSVLAGGPIHVLQDRWTSAHKSTLGFVGLELHPVSLIPTDKAMNSLFDRCRDVEGFSMNLVETATSAFGGKCCKISIASTGVDRAAVREALEAAGLRVSSLQDILTGLQQPAAPKGVTLLTERSRK
eukprot:scaffold6640_cov335-Pinguiococcus_pyrenoidosus.AAC.1